MDSKELKALEEKGYKDLWYVVLRNGGMMIIDDGSTSLRNLLVKCYPFGLLLWYWDLIGLLLASLYIERHNVDNFLEAAHYTVMMISLTGGNIDFLVYRNEIDVLLRYVGMEFFVYDEEEHEAHKEIKRKMLKEVRTLSIAGNIIYVMMGLIIAVVQPCIYYLSSAGEDWGKTGQNPYLPIPMHFPWDTFSVEGFIYAYLMQIVGSALVVANVIGNGFSYVNLMVVFRSQLEILNHSIKNIEPRAIQRYRKKYGSLNEINIKSELEINERLKECFCACLKQNIMHHQCLIRWESISRKILRIILLFVFFNASILMASTGYLLLKNLHSKVRTLKFIQLLVTEIFHTFLFCYYGEQISQQSEYLFENLYDIGWYKCGKEFNSLLLMMMLITIKPIRSLTAIFNTPCSLETFNNLMSSAYSYFSLINGMKDNI